MRSPGIASWPAAATPPSRDERGDRTFRPRREHDEPGGVTQQKRGDDRADVPRSLDWYTSIAFTEPTRFEEDGRLTSGWYRWVRPRLCSTAGERGWFYTDQVDAIYLLPKWRDVAFGQHIDDMFCSARQFSIHDPDGYELSFIQAG
jgi:hypothetical protein